MPQPAIDVTSEPVLDPVLDFMRLLWGIEHALQSASKRMESAIGITGPQRLVLRVVARFPGLSAKDLAHVVRLHPSTVTGGGEEVHSSYAWDCRISDRAGAVDRSTEGHRERAPRARGRCHVAWSQSVSERGFRSRTKWRQCCTP